MKIVNLSKIPDALFRYLSQDSYDYDAKGDSLSATELLNPTQIVILKRRHWNEIVVDGADRLWQMLGNGVHAILEKEDGIEKIERLKVRILGREVSGKWDRIFKNEITDYKVTSVWTVIYKSRNLEWKLQLSIYRWLYFRVKGVLLNSKGFIVALLRDWSKKDMTKKNYPDFGAVQVELDLLTPDETEAYVTAKVKTIIEAEKLSDNALPECTDEERWYNYQKKTYLRCKDYCEVSPFCKQLEREKKRESIPDGEVLFQEPPEAA